jgi:hypothetical protein
MDYDHLYLRAMVVLIGKHKGTGKTKFKNQTVALCQNCGYRWEVKQ